MSQQGWIKIHRKIEQNDLWFYEPFSKAQAWIDLLILANHKDSEISVRGNILKIQRGQVGWSKDSLAKRWQWSKNKVFRFLDFLESKKQIIQVSKLIADLNGSEIKKMKPQKSNILGLIDIVNYDKYQLDDTADDTAERPQKDRRRYQDKNDKNVKNEKEVIHRAVEKFLKPSIEEIQEYCEERNNNISAQVFYDYYESNGWMVGRNHMNDWKAAIRTWEQKRQKDEPKKDNFKYVNPKPGQNAYIAP